MTDMSFLPQQSTTGELAQRQIEEWNRENAQRFDFSPPAKLSAPSLETIRQIVREEVRKALQEAVK